MDPKKSIRSCLIMSAVFGAMYLFFRGPWHYLIVVACGLIAALVIWIVSRTRR